MFHHLRGWAVPLAAIAIVALVVGVPSSPAWPQAVALGAPPPERTSSCPPGRAATPLGDCLAPLAASDVLYVPLVWCELPVQGRIAFISCCDRGCDIHVMKGDGSEVTQVTEDGAGYVTPAWSPDGQSLVFVSLRDVGWGIYTMRLDGSGLTRLTTDPWADGAPAWSPDGRKIAFTSYRSGDCGEPCSSIYVMNADGSGRTRLTYFPGVAGQPTWSPDGQRIAFTANWENPGSIYVMNADGTGLVKLSSGRDDGTPAWSPDGSRIAYTCSDDAGHPRICVMNADGSGQTILIDSPAGDWGPTWSPDGRKIAFVSQRDPDYLQIYTANSDGTGERRITGGDVAGGRDPAWSRN